MRHDGSGGFWAALKPWGGSFELGRTLDSVGAWIEDFKCPLESGLKLVDFLCYCRTSFDERS